MANIKVRIDRLRLFCFEFIRGSESFGFMWKNGM